MFLKEKTGSKDFLPMKLFEPFQLKGLLLRNRIVMASMGTNLADPQGFVTDEMVSYYVERAKGGAGLIITELVTVDFPSGNAIERQLSIDDDKYIPGLKRLAAQVKKYGSRIFIQLNHAGNRAKPQITGVPFPVSASNVPSSRVNVQPRPLRLEEIGNLIESFRQAARRAKEAGFDGIDLHCAHGYLLCQFLSNYTNKRLDGYGGGIRNRCRLPIEVLQGCRDEVGKDFLISSKVTGNQYIDGGTTPREAKMFCRLLEERGIDAIQVSGGDSESDYHFPVPPMYVPRGCYVKLAESIKRVVKIPVISVGRINDLKLANQIVEDGKADLVAMGRAFLADPYFPRKALESRIEDIRPCVGCNQGCIGRDRTKYLIVGCALNPQAGREGGRARIARAKVIRKILVVGGGPGGLEAARVAALRGHQVTLIEVERRLGGQLQLAAKPPGRREFRNLIKWYRIQMTKLGVRVILGRKANPELIKGVSPDLIIIATGAKPHALQIEGLAPGELVNASQILEGQIQTGARVAIIGGGSVGLETADLLAMEGRKVTVLEKLSEIGRDMEAYNKRVLMGRLSRNGVQIVTRVTIKKVNGGKLFIRRNGKKRTIAFDGPLINATGTEANKEVFKSLRKSGELRNLGVYELGDCVSPRQLRDAIFEGYVISRGI
jgi:2,4-dienoyl-CoA reductase-like NADH-dependent reductase (Old Yellow Enzyme family)/thioredoxin reductase